MNPPPTRRGPILLVVAVCLVLGGLAASRFVGGPRYQGHGLRYWFPVWGMSAEEWYETRLPRLVEAGPEALPVLLAVANELESAGEQRLAGLMGDAPESLQGWLPSRIDAAKRLEMVRHIWPRWVASSEANVRAFTNAFAALPQEMQFEALRMLSHQPRFREVLVPHRLSLLENATNGKVAVEAGLGLLQRAPDTDEAVLERVLRVLPGLPTSSWQDHTPFGMGLLVYGLAPQTARLRSAEPWLRGWLNTGTPPFRASAVQLLPFIAPDQHPVGKTLAEAWPRLGPVGVAQLLRCRPAWFDRDEHRSTRRAFADALAPLLFSQSLADWGARWEQSSDPALRDPNRASLARLSERRFFWVVEQGPDAAAAAPFLPDYFGEKPADAFRVAQALGRIGPVAPGTIPRLLPGLTNEVTVGPLVLLLAAYGPAAREALPNLESLAADTVAFGPRPSLGSLTAQEAARLGLPSPVAVREFRRGPGVSASRLNFGPELAAETGLTGVWPGLVTSTNRVSLAELAASAIRRIRSDER